MPKDDYINVSKNSPCPICSKVDWCKISKDGKLALCNRIGEGSYKKLNTGWLHKLQDDTPKKQAKRQIKKPLTISDYATAKKLPVSFLKTEFSMKEFRGGLVVPYENDESKTTSTRFRLAMTGKDKFRWKKGSNASESLYNAQRLSEYAKNGVLVVVEGESDVHSGHYHKLPIVGIPGKHSGIDNLANQIIKYKFHTVHVIVEPDAKGQIEVDIASALSKRQYKGKLFAVSLPVKDLSELHCKHPDDFNELLEQSKKEAAPVDIELKPLSDRLNDVRTEGVKQFERRSQLAAIIKGDMLYQGEFIRTAEGHCYYFDKIKKRLHTVSRDSGQTEILLYQIAGLNKADPDYLYIVNELANYTAIHGRLSDVWQFSRFQDGKLYLSRFNGRVYVLDGQTTVSADNGVDGVLFLDHQDWEPWELTEDKGTTLADIIDQINFDYNEILTCQEYRVLFIAYLFSLFFRDLTQGAVISAFIGEKGSGMTTLIRLVGKILFGDGFEVRSVEKGKEESFLVMISNQHFLGLDNLDGNIGWLNDHLATIATGTYITKRRLYTTNEEYRIKPRVFISISSRTPAFKRDDVADRLLIFRLQRFEKFIPERILLEQITKNRNALLSQIVHDLNAVIGEINRKSDAQVETDFRMADFAILGEKIWRAIGGDEGAESFRNVIGKMKTAQEAFSIEDDPLPDLISEWVEDNPCSTGVTAAELFAKLKDIADSKHIPFNLKSAKSLGRQIGMIAQPMAEFYGIKISHYQGRGRTRFWTFSQESDPHLWDKNAGESGGESAEQLSPINT